MERTNRTFSKRINITESQDVNIFQVSGDVYKLEKAKGEG